MNIQYVSRPSGFVCFGDTGIIPNSNPDKKVVKVKKKDKKK